MRSHADNRERIQSIILEEDPPKARGRGQARLHGLLPADRRTYAEMLRRAIAVGGSFVLYAWAPRIINGQTHGLTPKEVKDELGDSFRANWVREGEEQGGPFYR